MAVCRNTCGPRFLPVSRQNRAPRPERDRSKSLVGGLRLLAGRAAAFERGFRAMPQSVEGGKKRRGQIGPPGSKMRGRGYRHAEVSSVEMRPWPLKRRVTFGENRGVAIHVRTWPGLRILRQATWVQGEVQRSRAKFFDAGVSSLWVNKDSKQRPGQLRHS